MINTAVVMRNKLLAVELGKSYRLNQSNSNNWDSLKNKFSGARLFKHSYFNLICGDNSFPGSTKNKWFLDTILDECSKGDINLLPAIKKITFDPSMDEGIRQRSSEILENAEGRFIPERGMKTPDPGSEEKKFLEAKTILAGIRTPQISQVLRMLKDKSIELQRLGIFMIGKFRMTDMLPELCECLNTPGLEEDTISVIRIFKEKADSELYKCYFKYSGNVNTCKNILYILGRYNSRENISFCFERLWSASRLLKEVALECLIANNFKASGEENGRLKELMSEVTGILTWLLAAKISLRKENKESLTDIAEKEYKRWKQFLSGLITITDLTDDQDSKYTNLNTSEADDIISVTEMVNIIFEDKNSPLKGDGTSSLVNDEKRLKKLHTIFPGEIMEFDELCEDIINCDYNKVSIWTKACVLRGMKGIGRGDARDSVIALLFSPEEILREEAVKLMTRSDEKFFSSVSQRIPGKTKQKLEGIISGNVEDGELLFEKTKFLSSLFPGIYEDELLVLAGHMKYITDPEAEILNIENNCIIWIVSPDMPYHEVIILNGEHNGKIRERVLNNQNLRYYIVKLEAVETFHRLFPERSFEVVKYIDNNEE